MSSPQLPSTAAASRFGDRFGLAAFVESLSSPTETPASGSAAAATAALAAALVANVARTAHDPGTAAQADALAGRLTGLAADDADAYEAAVRALDRPGDGSETSDFLLGTMLRRAADVPLQIAEAAGDVAVLAAEVAATAPAAQRADAVGAARLAEGAARAAAHLVEINLVARAGDERHTRAREAVATAVAANVALDGGNG
ncbi:MAG TPA: cyclodeaminase/cyclohydrolase family protein [Gaiellaceae bacterium]